MARRSGFLHGSVLLSLSILNSLAAPATATGGLCESAVIVHGYKCHEFEVTTDDGYILGLQRIPEGRSRGGASDVAKKRPVILQHGVLADGTMWLLNPSEQDLPLILADNGFDVWIANARGTSFSRKHVTLDSSSRQYWDWTWDEMVTHDLPAIFDFVFTQTNQKIDYVGHSLGTLVMLASLSEGKLLDKVRSAALLSPIAYFGHITTPIGALIALIARVLVGEHYGVAIPPAYNLANIPRDFPLFMSYNGRDTISDPRDVQDALDIINQHEIDKLHAQFEKEYAHLHFIMAVIAKDLVYDSVVSFFKGE